MLKGLVSGLVKGIRGVVGGCFFCRVELECEDVLGVYKEAVVRGCVVRVLIACFGRMRVY